MTQMNSIFTFILILYLAHLLACCWYWVGTSEDPEGWVVRNDVHNLTEAPHSAKYAASIYTIFKLGDGFAVTPQEQVFAFASEIAISLIYGALAGVMSTMMMAGSVGEQEYLVKLAQLKVCSTPSGLPCPPPRARLTRHPSHVMCSGVDEGEAHDDVGEGAADVAVLRQPPVLLLL